MIFLYPEKATNFNNNGLGALSDAIECTVEWERNSIYELQMIYPVTGIHYDEIKYGRIILAKPTPAKQAQPFVIYKIEAPIDGRTTINAQHISYELNGIPITPYTAPGAAQAMAGIVSNSLAANRFTFTTDVTTQSSFNPSAPNSVRKYLGGMEGSILDQFGGEYEFDRFNVILHQQMGQDRGVTLRYGKNITDINQETNIENTVTGVFPYYVNGDTKVYGGISYAENHASFPVENIESVDVSADFSEETPTVAQVTAAGARNLKSRSYIGVPSVSIEVSFAPIWESEEYKDLGFIEEVEPCDIVTVIFERLGVNSKAKVEKTSYNVLLGRYNKVEIGDLKKSITSAIVTQQKAIETVASDLVTTEQVLTGEINEVADDLVELADSTTSRFTVTNAAITAEVENREAGDRSVLQVTSNAITAEVTRATAAEGNLSASITVNAEAIETKVSKNGVISSINQSAEAVKINASKIELTGYVTVTDLSASGTTTIDGGRINTDTLYVNKIRSNSDQGSMVLDGSGIYSPVAYHDWSFRQPITVNTNRTSFGNSTFYGQLTASGKIHANNYNEDNAGMELVTGSGTGQNLILTSANNVMVESSSRRWKHDIDYNLPEDMDPHKLYDLKPCKFVFNTDHLSDMTDERYGKPVIGFIAEDVDEIYPAAAFHDKYGSCIDWGTRYIVPPMLFLIQEQHDEIESLKTRISELERRL